MPERLRSASNSKYPLASVIDDPDTFKQAKELLILATEIKVKISKLEEREAEAKEALAAICTAYNLDGFRWGLHCFEYHGWQTRETLSKEALIANGVTAEQIAASFIKGEPFLMTKVNPFDLE
jgi:hypothetical protein